MKIEFSDDAWADYLEWFERDRKLLKRINRLIGECCRAPFEGMGKPEPLRGDLSGYWSRRITQEDRLVYRVIGKAPDQTLAIIQCRRHY